MAMEKQAAALLGFFPNWRSMRNSCKKG